MTTCHRVIEGRRCRNRATHVVPNAPGRGRYRVCVVCARETPGAVPVQRSVRPLGPNQRLVLALLVSADKTARDLEYDHPALDLDRVYGTIETLSRRGLVDCTTMEFDSRCGRMVRVYGLTDKGREKAQEIWGEDGPEEEEGMTLPEVDMGLQAKLGSIVVHLEEGLSMTGHVFDWAAAEALVEDPDVQNWLDQLRKLALVPEKREAR